MSCSGVHTPLQTIIARGGLVTDFLRSPGLRASRESFGALGALGTLNALARSSAAAPIARLAITRREYSHRTASRLDNRMQFVR